MVPLAAAALRSSGTPISSGSRPGGTGTPAPPFVTPIPLVPGTLPCVGPGPPTAPGPPTPDVPGPVVAPGTPRPDSPPTDRSLLPRAAAPCTVVPPAVAVQNASATATPDNALRRIRSGTSRTRIDSTCSR